MSNRLGLSGGIARRFQDNALTPLLAMTALLLGVFAVIVTPREEEPQIDVTLANVFVAYPGASTISLPFPWSRCLPKSTASSMSIRYRVPVSAC
jgi:hypothetical protein